MSFIECSFFVTLYELTCFISTRVIWCLLFLRSLLFIIMEFAYASIDYGRLEQSLIVLIETCYI